MYVITRAETIAKLFFVISFVGLFLYIVLAFYTFHTAYLSVTQTRRNQKKIQNFPDPNIAPLKPSAGLKHVLLWTKENGNNNPIGEGREPFVNQDCLHQNCYITTNKQLLGDYTKFNAVIFNASDLKKWNKAGLPLRRSWDQKYIFYGMAPMALVPICHPAADTYFNWTWSYKLYSDIENPFIIVKKLQGQIVAPNPTVFWDTKLYQPIDAMQKLYATKKKALAWIIRDCNPKYSMRIVNIVKSFRDYFAKYNLEFDIFGCGHIPCTDNECLHVIRRDYFFYWVLEWTMSYDYMTDEVVTAFETETVPVIIGNLDVAKFLPPGSYIFSRLSDFLQIESIIQVMMYAMNNPNIYSGFFRWKKHFTVHRTSKYYGLCQLCSHLNNDELMKRHTHYEMFRSWWFPGKARCLKSIRPRHSVKVTYPGAGTNFTNDYEAGLKDEVFPLEAKAYEAKLVGV